MLRYIKHSFSLQICQRLRYERADHNASVATLVEGLGVVTPPEQPVESTCMIRIGNNGLAPERPSGAVRLTRMEAGELYA